MKISQREARRLRKRVEEFESQQDGQRRAWSADWPGGVEIARHTFDSSSAPVPTAVRVARRLGHAVVAVGDEGGWIRFMALPVAKR